jgi:hypothetical protein
MEKKIELQTKDGRIIRVMPHMVKDFARFGATQTKRNIKEPPVELKKKPPLPDLNLKPELMKIIPSGNQSNLPEMNNNLPTDLKEVKVRKTPVKSKTTKK